MSALTIASAHAFAMKKLDRASQTLQIRTEQQAKKARKKAAREEAAIARRFEGEQREADFRLRRLWRKLHTRVRLERKLIHTPPKTRERLWPYASVALPTYGGPVLDRRGERAVFARVRYYSRRSAGQGVSARVVRYIFHGAAVDASGAPYQYSNVGLTIDETLCAFDHLEQVNWSASRYAKLLMHGILAVDHRQTPDEMMACGVRWAEETLGRFDLPYLVTLHAPPEDGDQRNWHIHVVWSFRPLVRTGDHEWQVGEMLRTDLDNPAAMKLMREMFAAVMTDVSFEAGQNQVWTAKSNADRGLPHEPQVHLGGAATNRARNGEHVAANEENHERVLRSNAAMLDEELRHADDALARRQEVDRAVTGRWARLPKLPAPVPERFIAASIATALPDTGGVVPLAPARTVAPSTVPAERIEPLPLPNPLSPPPMAAALPPAGDHGFSSPATAVPTLSPQPSLAGIPNLRIRPLPSANITITAPPLPARHIAAASPPVLAPLQSKPVPPRSMHSLPPSVRPPMRVRVRMPALPALTSQILRPAVYTSPPAPPPRAIATQPMNLSPSTVPLPPRAATLDVVDSALRRVGEAQQKDEERQRKEFVRAALAAEQAAERAAAHERARSVLARLFETIAQERHYLAEKDGRRIVPPALLARFGLTDDEVEHADAQQQLARIVITQADEVSRIASYVRGHPDQLHQRNNRWTLDAAAPGDIRMLVEAWRNEPAMQAALERTARAAPISTSDGPSPAASGPTAWQRARAARAQAMAEWDEVERIDQAGAITPGRRVARPGKNRPQDGPGVRPGIPSSPGLGLGD